MMETTNYVARLNEFAQRTQSELKYQDLGSVGADHIKTFTQRAVVSGKEYSNGVGKTKKEAKQNAAKNALKCLLENEDQDSVASTEIAPEASTASVHQTSTSNINYICWLNEYGNKNRVIIKAVESTRLGPNNAILFLVGDKEYPPGTGETKREAKEEAAKLVYDMICGSKTTETADEKLNQEKDFNRNLSDISNKMGAISVNSDNTETNYIGLLNDYCQKTKTAHNIIEEKRCGPSHDFKFFYKVVIKDKAYPVGEGTTAKIAKQNAAQLAWNALQEQSDSKVSEGSTVSEDGSPRDPHESSSSNPSIAQIENAADASTTSSPNRNLTDISNKMRSISVNSDNSVTETNYIGLLNHYCQKTKIAHNIIEEKRCGPSHDLKFCYKVVIDGEDYPVGEGKSIKVAKQNAAQLAWSALQEQSDWNSKVSVRSTVSEDGSPPDSRSSSQNTSESTSDSIIFAVSSNRSNAQMPCKSTLPTMMSTSPSLDSSASSQSMSRSSLSSGLSADSSDSSKDQLAVKNENMGNIQNQITTHTRFTSDFDIICHLGSGTFGCVYKARHKLEDKFYAVKIVRCEEKSLREVKTLSELYHLNIVTYNTSWLEDSQYQFNVLAGSDSFSQSAYKPSAKHLYIQMELCNTETLKQWIEKKNTQSSQDSNRREESLRIAQQILSGVEYIHSKEHIHRDLKPANILFGLDGQVKIGDFGLVTRDDALIERTLDKGSPVYMAPEQETEKNYDRKVDIFPLGLIYLELLWKLFTGQERGVVLQNARGQKLPEEFARTFPKENQIIKSMLSKKPEDRPEASAVKAELEKWAQLFKGQNKHRENATI